MIKQPANLATWLVYYRDIIGVERFFLRVEDTPELAALFAHDPWSTLVDAVFDNGTHRDYFAQMDRQSAHIAEVTVRAQREGLTHLLHVDDDELVYCSAGARMLRAELATASPLKPDVHMLNIEALCPSADCSNPFKEVTAFRHVPTRYCSYTNGKSFGRLDAAGLRAHGPHHFRCADGAGGSNSVVTHTIPPWVAIVLHYESATFSKWRHKFLELALRHGDDEAVHARVPFTFYRQSMLAALRVIRSRDDPDKEAAAESAAYALWCKYKLAPANLPKPMQGAPLVLQEGVTVLSPWPNAHGRATQRTIVSGPAQRGLENGDASES
mmetsp:Transcript_36056/g.81805  ORF Transcript_36056/g.81805 Transcript_36056/m.81805 type:complete len:326 (-) Transcript_36056:405-1382(-)